MWEHSLSGSFNYVVFQNILISRDYSNQLSEAYPEILIVIYKTYSSNIADIGKAAEISRIGIPAGCSS